MKVTKEIAHAIAADGLSGFCHAQRDGCACAERRDWFAVLQFAS
jgi:hypothetical protein